MQVSDAVRLKRAVRDFSDVQLPDEVVTAILDAGRRSQSGGNSQPWHFVAVRDREIMSALSKCGQWAGHLADAMLGIVIVTPPDPNGWNKFDAGQAAACSQLTAWELGIGSCIAGLFDAKASQELLGSPGDLERVRHFS